MQRKNFPHPWFSVYGIELEYMIVKRDNLSVFPITDQILKAKTGTFSQSVENGEIDWSNELVNHVIEIKTHRPATELTGLAGVFQRNVQEIEALCAAQDGTLLPTGMHPWMDPETDLHLWAHGDQAIYQNYHRIFNCAGHGWANLQSTHVNLPFSNDAEFTLLHNAIRLLLPILPALAASTPFVENKLTGIADNRLMYYKSNQKKFPEISGAIIPEYVDSMADYQARILTPMYQAIAPQDPENLLQHEWLNSRGAIARFDRGAIEIRLLDIQETPLADLAIVLAIICVLKKLCFSWKKSVQVSGYLSEQQLLETYQVCIRDGSDAKIEDSDYLALLLGPSAKKMRAKNVWKNLLEQVDWPDTCQAERVALAHILDYGCLSRRMTNWLSDRPNQRLKDLYQVLHVCLIEGHLL